MPDASSNPHHDPRLEAVLRYIQRWIEYRVWSTGIPGAQYAVRKDGELLLSGATGVADLDTGEPLTTKHLFRIASHSKMFTATATMQLVERGSMRLDAELGEYIAELSGSPMGERTIRELLDHTAGVVRDGADGDYWQRSRAFPDTAELLEMTREAGLKTDAGVRFAYSNVGYALLGLAVSRVTGGSWDEYVKTEIIDRLMLSDTYPDFPAERADDLAPGYSGVHTSRERAKIPHVVVQSLAPAGGITSTAEDASAFLDAHRVGNERLLSDHSKRSMQRVSSSEPEGYKSGDGYGLGMIIEEIGGRRVVGHSGGYTGHITWTVLEPIDGLVVSVMTNSVDGAPYEIGAGVLRLLRAALDTSREGSTDTKSLGDTGRFEGRFANVWKVTDVVRIGDRLLALFPELSDPLSVVDELKVIDDHTLQLVRGGGYGAVDEPIEYDFAADGSTRSVRIGFGMSSWPFEVGRSFQDPWTRFE